MLFAFNPGGRLGGIIMAISQMRTLRLSEVKCIVTQLVNGRSEWNPGFLTPDEFVPAFI